MTGPEKEPTAEDLARKQQLSEDAKAAWATFKEFKQTATSKEAIEELKTTAKYKSLLKKYHSLRSAAFKVTADPVKRGDFVWLFRRR